MSGEPRPMIIGPEHNEIWWINKNPAGDCEECGGQCDGKECGMHAAGCLFGGFSNGYWIYSPSCPLFHGEEKKGKP